MNQRSDGFWYWVICFGSNSITSVSFSRQRSWLRCVTSSMFVIRSYNETWCVTEYSDSSFFECLGNRDKYCCYLAIIAEIYYKSSPTFHLHLQKLTTWKEATSCTDFPKLAISKHRPSWPLAITNQASLLITRHQSPSFIIVYHHHRLPPSLKTTIHRVVNHSPLANRGSCASRRLQIATDLAAAIGLPPDEVGWWRCHVREVGRWQENNHGWLMMFLMWMMCF